MKMTRFSEKIFSVNWPQDSYFDPYLPADFYRNFAGGKFSRTIYPKYSDRAAWAKARRNHYAGTILREADRIKDGEVPQLLFSNFRKFPEAGDRFSFERPYFKRRMNIAHLAVAWCLTGDREKYMPRLMDHLVAVMEEHTWTVPAHSIWDKNRLLDWKPSDLFCSETGALMALVHLLLGEELDREYENFSERIRTRVLERTVYNVLFDPESEKMHWWYTKERPGNWTPWCAYSNLLCTVLLEKDTEKLSLFVHEFMKVTARFAAHYPDDGYCEEGPSYYGKASLMMFASLYLMHKAQPGSMDKLFAVPRIRAMMEFIAELRMNPGQMLAFGDSHPEVEVNLSLLIPCAMLLKSDILMDFCIGATPTMSFLSDILNQELGFLFDCPEILPRSSRKREGLTCFENHLAVVRKGNFVSALKVGNNAEYHNHNDLGHFVLYHNDEPIIVDAGCALYRKINFSPQRYTLWYTRGSGHNAPVFGDVEQLPGDQYTASFSCADPLNITADLGRAYPAEAKLRLFRRTLSAAAGEVILSDEFELEDPLPAAVTLLTPSPVRVIGKNRLEIGGVLLETENIDFDSMEKMPVLDMFSYGAPAYSWNCSLTALRFKTGGTKYRFVFRPQVGRAGSEEKP